MCDRRACCAAGAFGLGALLCWVRHLEPVHVDGRLTLQFIYSHTADQGRVAGRWWMSPWQVTCGIPDHQVDGTAYLSSFVHKSRHLGFWDGK